MPADRLVQYPPLGFLSYRPDLCGYICPKCEELVLTDAQLRHWAQGETSAEAIFTFLGGHACVSSHPPFLLRP